MPSTETWVAVGVVLALWFVREALTIVVKFYSNVKGTVPQVPERPITDESAADQSGRFDAVLSKFATKDEVQSVKTDLSSHVNDVREKIDEHAKTSAHQFNELHTEFKKINRSIGQIEGKLGIKKEN